MHLCMSRPAARGSTTCSDRSRSSRRSCYPLLSDRSGLATSAYGLQGRIGTSAKHLTLRWRIHESSVKKEILNVAENPMPLAHRNQPSLLKSVSTPTVSSRNPVSLKKPDLDYIASRLAQIRGVIAIYTSNSAGETHVWVILDTWSEEILERVYKRQIELEKWYGENLGSVDFHVMERVSADRYKSGWSKCQIKPI